MTNVDRIGVHSCALMEANVLASMLESTGTLSQNHVPFAYLPERVVSRTAHAAQSRQRGLGGQMRK